MADEITFDEMWGQLKSQSPKHREMLEKAEKAADLINRQAVKDAFHAYMARRFDKDRCADAENCEVCERRCLWHEVVASVSAVDAVEVVRCKDCEYYENEECGNPYIWMSDGAHMWPDSDFYCSYGERREENARETD